MPAQRHLGFPSVLRKMRKNAGISKVDMGSAVGLPPEGVVDAEHVTERLTVDQARCWAERSGYSLAATLLQPEQRLSARNNCLHTMRAWTGQGEFCCDCGAQTSMCRNVG
jgi:hypothetical protein